MKSLTIGIREAKAQLSRLVSEAERGTEWIITDRGRPAYVLMRHETYRRLSRRGPGIRALLSHAESEHVMFEPPRLGGEKLRPAGLG